MELLQLLKRYKNDFRAALVGTYKGGRYVEPPAIQISQAIFLAPLALSVLPILLLKNPLAQWAAGVGVILSTYMATYLYLRQRCFMPDVVKVVRTNYGDVDYLRRNKIHILENPHALPGDYELYYGRGGVCVARDRRAGAFTLDGPRGPVIYLTTGLYARLNAEEVEAVLEHERGHLKYRHTYKLLAFLIAEYTLRLPLVHLVYQSVFLLAAHLLGVTLLFSALLQAFEYEADRHAVRKHGERLASALVKLDWNGVVESLVSPTAARLTLLARTHPLTIDRLRRINAVPR
ncbi:MAG: M56 family metallopeptidase [Pyrobaculum sp.]